MDNLTSMAYSLGAVITAIALVLAGTIFLYSHLTMQDPREPPQAPSAVPFIGHVVGLARSKFNYYVQLRQDRVRALEHFRE